MLVAFAMVFLYDDLFGAGGHQFFGLERCASRHLGSHTCPRDVRAAKSLVVVDGVQVKRARSSLVSDLCSTMFVFVVASGLSLSLCSLPCALTTTQQDLYFVAQFANKKHESY